MSSGDKTTDQIVEDRIYDLFDLFKNHPPHAVRKLFKKKYNIEITISDLQNIYEIWFNDHTYAKSVPLKNLRKTDWWGKIEERIRKQAVKDLSDFIYNHWKKAGNK